MESNELLQAISDMMDKKLDDKLKPINDRLDKMDGRLDKMDNRLDKMDNRLDKIESDVSALKVSQRAIKDKVTDTYNLALEAWGQSTENRHWLENEKAIG